jgi:hypothetical protein
VIVRFVAWLHLSPFPVSDNSEGWFEELTNMSNNPMLLYTGEYESFKETKALHRKRFVSSSLCVALAYTAALLTVEDQHLQTNSDRHNPCHEYLL